MNNLLKTKRVKMTVAMISSYLSMLIFVACVEDPEINPFGECGGPKKVNATGLNLFYEPYNNNQYANESDTVRVENFGIYLRIDSEPLADASYPTSTFPGKAYGLSCAPNLDFQNITSISITLLAPYGGKAAGTNITSLVTTHDDVKLSDLREFKHSMGQYKLTVNLIPENNSQLNTRTVLKLKNGTDKIIESTSPVLLTN